MPAYGDKKPMPASAGFRDRDIQLPNPSGKVDPRIKRRQSSPLEGLRRVGEGIRQLRDKGLVK